MDDHQFSLKIIESLRKNGVLFSIDDFCNGYSSFRYLSKFKENILKIDKIFIDEIYVNKDNRHIAKSIISLAHNMVMKVIAEGVENIEQLNCLQTLNCDIAQGFYFIRALPADEMKDLFLKYI